MLKKIKTFLSSSRLLLIIAAMLIFMAIYDYSFYSPENLLNIILNTSINGILAVGMTMLMIARAFDISVGSIMVLSGVISILLVNQFGAAAGITIGILSGVLMGLINGILVAKIKINSFISTLGTMVIYQGIAFALTDMKPVTSESQIFQNFADTNILGMPAIIFYFILVTIIIWLILKYTKLGKNAYGIGGNESACRMMGINVELYTIIFFVISGLYASFAGVLLSSKINAASGTFGENIALVVIAAIVLGGVHLSGGVGSIFGVIQGIVLLGLIDNITVFLGLFGYYQKFFWSMLLICVVIFDVIYIKYTTNKLQFEELFKLKGLINSKTS